MIERGSFVAFLVYLRQQQGFRIGPDQLEQAIALVEKLAKKGNAPEQVQAWSAWLGPLLCCTAKEQERFAALWRQWFETFATTGKPGAGSEQSAIAEARPQEPKMKAQKHSPFARWKGAAKALLYGMLLIMALSYFNFIFFGPSDYSNEEQDARRLYVYLILFGALCSGLLLGLLLLLRLKRGEPAAYLIRAYSALRKDPKSVGIPLDSAYLRQGLRELLKGLNRKRFRETGDLDGEATARATARQGGYFTPVWQKRKEWPHYLILLEKSGPYDQRHHWLEKWVQQWEKAKIGLALFSFQGDPRLLQAAKDGRNWRLEKLADGYPDSELLIFAEGKGFLHPYTREPQPWLELLERWPVRRFFSSEPPSEWGRLQQVLHTRGFRLAWGAREGLLAAFASPQERRDSNVIAAPTDERFAVLLAHKDFRSGLDPGPQARADWLEHLKFALPERSFAWLCACAVFPELHWELTLALGQELVDQEGQPFFSEAGLEALHRLPWFRQGALPEWLRETLLDQLEPENEAPIRAFIIRVLARCTPERVEGLLLQIHSEQEFFPLFGQKEPFQDRYFLQVVTRKRPNRLAQKIPPALRRLLFREGQPQLGLRAGVLLLLTSTWAFVFTSLLLRLLSLARLLDPGQPLAWLVLSLSLFLLFSPLWLHWYRNQREQAMPGKERKGKGGIGTREQAEEARPSDQSTAAGSVQPAALTPQAESAVTALPVQAGLLAPGQDAGERRVLRAEGEDFAFRWIPPGSFLMGSPADEQDRRDDEVQHRVTLSQGYWLQETAVTQRQWQAIMGNDPSHFKAANRPVEQVSWMEAKAYCEKLSEKLGLEIRLPTEAEWEYACRSGTTTAFHFGNRLDATMANFDGNYPYGGADVGEYRNKTVEVKSFAPNPWGLYEMHGNVWEWCEDWYGAYPSGELWDPKGPSQGTDRVLRGGSWRYDGRGCRSADRLGDEPGYRNRNYGFRLATSSSGK